MQSIRKRAPKASSAATRRVMQANVGRETRPENKLRRALASAGLRYRKEVRPEPKIRCTADFVFSKARVCLFVDGCFWHGCPKHFSLPKKNSSWWSEKIEANVARDARQTRELQKKGWLVFRFWEHQITDVDLPKHLAKIRQALTVGT